jgi:mannitol operon transcriptional antiterminator
MTVVLPLDSRQARITRLLLADRKPATLDALASQLNLTTRIVRYNLPPVESFLRSAGLDVVRRRGVGIWVSGDDDRRRRTLTSLDPGATAQVLAAEDRKLRALVTLLDASPEPVELGQLEVELGASRPTIRRDVKATEAWLEEHHLHLKRLPGIGVVVRGSEIEIRKGLLAIVLESMPAEALTDAMR